jgi:hypothetical protein
LFKQKREPMSDRKEKPSETNLRDENRDEALRRKLGFLKEELMRQKERIKEMKDLIGRKTEAHHENDLWEMSGKELDHEMGELLTYLDQDIDCLSPEKITSHRKIAGKLIVWAKRIVTRIILLFFSGVLQRQRRFNQCAVRFQLASFIRFRRLEKELEGIEKMMPEIEEQLENLLGELGSLSERPGDNGPER